MTPDIPPYANVDSRDDDAMSYPWAEGASGRWHRRPADSDWETAEGAGGYVLTACGEIVWTCHVSEFDPLAYDPNVEFCDYCKGAS